MRTYRVNITFQAVIENDLLGFYRSSYLQDQEKRYPCYPATVTLTLCNQTHNTLTHVTLTQVK